MLSSGFLGRSRHLEGLFDFIIGVDDGAVGHGRAAVRVLGLCSGLFGLR